MTKQKKLNIEDFYIDCNPEMVRNWAIPLAPKYQSYFDELFADIKKFQSDKKEEAIRMRSISIYTPKRKEKHKEILNSIFTDFQNKISKKPVFIMVAGRGGSGKSLFEGEVYNRENFVVLNT